MVTWEGSDGSSAGAGTRESWGGVQREELRGVDEMVGIGGLGAAEAAVRVNAAAMHVVFELMGWIPEGRQAPSLEMLSYRPCAVQVRASQAAITRPGCYNTPRDA